jgi:hypothetical protein
MPLSREDWPISEGLGVLFGVLGVDWLIDGKTSFLPALAITLGVCAMILIWRVWQRKKPD